jgi:hypothetical protein
MTTAAILESITDRSQFELLATSILRRAVPNYAGIIHTGINANGETIVSPIDGLHKIPHSNPPHYVFIQHTTTDRNRLEYKWLTADDADLPKALEQFRGVREKQPEADLTVVLCTNQRVDADLVLDGEQWGYDHQIAVDIWEQSRIADFLDHSGEGHFLRRKYLGIDAELLSLQLLHELGRKSLEHYRQATLLQNHPALIDRTTTSLVESLKQRGVVLIAGKSGYGKSVACSQALERLLNEGLPAIWLPAQRIQNTAGIELALNEWLRSLHPMLEPNAGRSAISLALASGGLIVCVDDINQESDSQGLLRVIFNAAAPTAQNHNSSLANSEPAQTRPELKIMVPVTEKLLSSVSSKLLEQDWITVKTIEGFSDTETLSLLRTIFPGNSVSELTTIADQLAGDPYLVGLFAFQADSRMSIDELRRLADDVSGSFLEEQFIRICDIPGTNLLPIDLEKALVSIAIEMILRRQLQPSWDQVVTWYSENSIELRGLRVLIGNSKVCSLVSGNQLRFRHDRLREYYLIKGMSNLLLELTTFRDVIIDPYYSSISGRALSLTEVSEDQLQTLRAVAPWILFEAVRQIGEPSSDHHTRIFNQALKWVSDDRPGVAEAVLMAVCWSMVETDSSRLLPIIATMPPFPLVMLSGLRNASALHGIQYMRAMMKFSFEPGSGDRLRTKIVEHARTKHAAQLASEMRAFLEKPDLNHIDACACLCLLGHLRLSGFDELISATWKRFGMHVIGCAIWAACRCPLNSARDVVNPLIEAIGKMPLRTDHTKMPTEREELVLYLGWGFRQGMTDSALAALIDVASHCKDLVPDVSLMIEGVDNPEAIEFVIRRLSANGGSNFWGNLTGIGDGEPKVQSRSVLTCERLRRIWESSTESDNTRRFAFCVWIRATGTSDLETLQSIGSDSCLYRFAIQHRIKLGDEAVIPEVLSLLRKQDMDGWWWVMVHRVWCGELYSLCSETLGEVGKSIPEDYSGGNGNLSRFLAELLMKIPASDAELLMKMHWDRLKYVPEMVQAALRVGTPGCAAMARESLANCPKNIDIFKFAFMHWRSGRRSNPITLQHLENLEPYLDRLTEDQVLQLAWNFEREIADNSKMANWVRRILIPRLPVDERSRVRASDECLMSHLDRQLQNVTFGPNLRYLFEDPDGNVRAQPDHVMRIVESWLSTNRSVRGLAIVAECLKCIGSRNNLTLLDRFLVSGDQSQIDLIKADTKFAVLNRTLS